MNTNSMHHDKEGGHHNDWHQQMSRAQRLLLELAGMYDHTITDGESLIWNTQVFQKYDDNIIFNALMAWATSSERFFPRPGAIIASLAPQADVSIIERAVKRFGPYKSPEIDDPVINGAIAAMGGWESVCSQMPDASQDPIAYEKYAKRIDKALIEAKRSVQVQGAFPPAPIGLLQRQSTATLRDQVALTNNASEPQPGRLNDGLDLLRHSVYKTSASLDNRDT